MTKSFTLPLAGVTIFWLLIGLVAPFVIPKGPNQTLIRLMLSMTAGCCYLFWLCIYLGQYKPLFAPQLSQEVAKAAVWGWGRKFD
ncbi:hypothetical protein SNEBB_004912 [Seison nebaliae]|nr:hypothetical protein SNEBB_004912 [Seison nebaliae]